jgi:hypothetical protein
MNYKVRKSWQKHDIHINMQKKKVEKLEKYIVEQHKRIQRLYGSIHYISKAVAAVHNELPPTIIMKTDGVKRENKGERHYK